MAPPIIAMTSKQQLFTKGFKNFLKVKDSMSRRKRALPLSTIDCHMEVNISKKSHALMTNIIRSKTLKPSRVDDQV